LASLQVLRRVSGERGRVRASACSFSYLDTAIGALLKNYVSFVQKERGRAL